jgi:alkylation response protein AidB-like acyl-CoA dehydrogenase
VTSAIQVHGGMGFTWEIDLHRYLRHILAVSKLFKLFKSGT